MTPGFAKAGGGWSGTARVFGTGFMPGAKVYWNGVERGSTTYVSSTEVTIALNPSDYSAAPDKQVTATNPGSAQSSPFAFKVLALSPADVDCDLDVDASDPLRVLQVLAGTGAAGPGCSADVDGNNAVQPADALYGLRVVSGALPE